MSLSLLVGTTVKARISNLHENEIIFFSDFQPKMLAFVLLSLALSFSGNTVDLIKLSDQDSH